MKKLVERATRKNVKTLLHPRGNIDGHLAISTIPSNYFNGYLIDRNKLKATESGGLVVSLPKRSNIRELDDELDKVVIKGWKGFRGSFFDSPKRTQLSWIDGFNRYAATRTETPDGISYVIRADAINEICQRGKIPVQCDESFCDALIPRKIKLDAGRYSVAMKEDPFEG